MENLIILLHLLTALAIIGLILLQQGKGAEMGASFGGGASQTLFGASGSGNFFSKMTAILAFVFFVTSFSLAVIAKQRANIDSDLPPAVIESSAQSDEAESELPELESFEAVDDLPEVAPEAGEGSTDELPEVPSE